MRKSLGDRSLHPRAVLGIDAAWTHAQPSGVAVAVETANGWKLAAVEASYEAFIRGREGRRTDDAKMPSGSVVVAADLLDAARRISRSPIDLIAVDMPMACYPITGRRLCDSEISTNYGAKHASTHSPSAERPGKISDPLRASFEALGYKLCTSMPANGLIEVYPHPALIEFLNAPRRLEYKTAKTTKYWPKLPLAERRRRLSAVWLQIVEALDRRISGVKAALPLPPDSDGGWRFKAYEDKLDAVVCAAVAIACLNGEAKAFGDKDAAIWVPNPTP